MIQTLAPIPLVVGQRWSTASLNPRAGHACGASGQQTNGREPPNPQSFHSPPPASDGRKAAASSGKATTTCRNSEGLTAEGACQITAACS